MQLIAIGLILAVIAPVAVASLIAFSAWQSWQRRRWPVFSNIAAGTHADSITRTADAVLARIVGADVAGYLVKEGATPGKTCAIIAASSDKPLGIALDGADAIGDPVAIGLLEATTKTRKMIAKGVIAIEADVYSYSDGRVIAEPTAAGTYWRVGRARTASGADNDIIEVETIQPVKVVVVAALTVGAAIADIAGGQSPTEAEHIEATTRINQIRADLLSLGTALATPAEVKILAA